MKFRKSPYYQPNAERIHVLKWYAGLNHEDVEPLNWDETQETQFTEWDPAASLYVGLDLEVDITGIYADCHLSQETALNIALSWESEGTSLKGCASKVTIDGFTPQKEFQLRTTLNGQDLYRSVDIIPTIAVSRPAANADHFAPRLPGTILWNSSRRVILGTSGMRFPIEVQDFSEAANFFPAGAAWFLDWDREGFDRPVHGGLRLYINSSHPVIKRAVSFDGKQDEADSRVRETVMYDVARTLITSAFESETYESQLNVYAAASIGNHIQNLMKALFPYDTYASLKIQWKFNRWLFDSRFQEAIKLFQKD